MKKLLTFLQNNQGWQIIAKSQADNARKLARKGLIYFAERTQEGEIAENPMCRIV